MKVRYLRYFGERDNGTIVIKSEKSNSPYRIFDYYKGMNMRVGVDVHENQVKFLVRNHADLFRIIEEEEVPEDILVMEIYKFLPKMANNLDIGAAAMLRKVAEATMEVLKVDFQRDDPELALEVMLDRLVEAYQEDVPNNDLVRIFRNVVADRADDEKPQTDKEKAAAKTTEETADKPVTRPTTLKFGSGGKKATTKKAGAKGN